jgi:hypothetical protein
MEGWRFKLASAALMMAASPDGKLTSVVAAAPVLKTSPKAPERTGDDCKE